MFGDEKDHEEEKDDLEVESDEVEDLDAPEKESEEAKGGMMAEGKPKIISCSEGGCTSRSDRALKTAIRPIAGVR